MNLLYPIGLLALAGLIIPVLIHLWNVKQGKTLKIGSIALLGENATSSSRSLKITDWLLFVLRCLLISIIAFFLAQPFIKTTVTNAKNLGWILIDRNQFAKVYQANKPTIDSLVDAGFELHDFNLGFKTFALKDSLDQIGKMPALGDDNLINQLNKQLPTGYLAYLFTDYRLSKFDGDLPKPNFNLIWKAVNDGDTVRTWSTKFLNKTYEGKSTPSLTSYTAAASQNLPPIKVAIYDPQATDSKYIKAALSAISDFTKREIEVTKWNALATDADVVFWLSEQTFNSTLKSGTKLFTYQKGKVLQINASLNLGSNENIALKQRIELATVQGHPIWTDGFGSPVLINKKEAQINHFYFYSRFNPQWTDLVWSEQFVKALMPIVLDNENAADFGFEENPLDQRLLAKEQILETKPIISTVYHTVKNQSIENVFWILAFVVLFIERILSLRKKPDHVKS